MYTEDDIRTGLKQWFGNYKDNPEDFTKEYTYEDNVGDYFITILNNLNKGI